MNREPVPEKMGIIDFDNPVDRQLLDLSLEWIDRLANGIGPRAAGSPEEMQALQSIRSYLESIGYETELQPFRFPDLPRYFPYLAIIGVFFIAGGFLTGWLRVVLIAAPFLAAALPELNTWLASLVPGQKVSAYLLVKPYGKNLSNLDYLLVSHVDSAQIVPRPASVLGFIFNNLMVIIEGISWVGAIFGILSVTQPALSASIYPSIRIVLIGAGAIIILIDLWQQLAHNGKVTDGANDNASGVAACIAIATVLQNQSTKQPAVGFLFTGAEEASLYGARSFVHQNQLHSLKVINLDMIGYGRRVGVVCRAGRLKPVATDANMNILVERFTQNIYKVDYRYRAGDFLPFLKAGTPAISLEATDQGGVPPTYHQSSDQAKTIQPKILNEILHITYQIIHH